MKILQEGSATGWGRELSCHGKGNGARGCGARLLVEQTDLYRDNSFVSFRCPCGTWNDVSLTELYSLKVENLPERSKEVAK